MPPDLLVSTKSQLESDKESATKSLWRLGTLAEQLSCGSGVLEEETRDWLDQEGAFIRSFEKVLSLMFAQVSIYGICQVFR